MSTRVPGCQKNSGLDSMALNALLAHFCYSQKNVGLKGLNKHVLNECLKKSNDNDGSHSSDVREFQVAGPDE